MTNKDNVDKSEEIKGDGDHPENKETDAVDENSIVNNIQECVEPSTEQILGPVLSREKRKESPCIEKENDIKHKKQVSLFGLPFHERDLVCDHDIAAFPVQVATIGDVHAIIAAAPVGVLPQAFENLPANVQALAGVPAALAALAAQTAALAAQNDAQTAALAALTVQTTALAAQFASLRDDVALANNRGCQSVGHALSPRVVPAAAGQLPEHFPATLSELFGMSGNRIDPFLIYWQVAGGVAGNLKVRRSRLGTFLGIPQGMLS